MGRVLKATRRKPKMNNQRQTMQSTPLLDSAPSRCLPSRETQNLKQTDSAAAGARLQNRDGFWELTFNNQTTVLPQDHSLFFVAVLLSEPAAQPLSAPALARKVFHAYGSHPDFLYGGIDWLRLHTDESDLAAILRLRRDALESLLEREDELEILKAEASRELASVYELIEALPFIARRNAEQAIRFLLDELRRLYVNLSAAVNLRGEPDEPVRLFALHLLCHILIPSLITESNDSETQLSTL
jgi:hypothetical protein